MNQQQSFSKFENFCDFLKEIWQFLLHLIALSGMKLPTFIVQSNVFIAVSWCTLLLFNYENFLNRKKNKVFPTNTKVATT